MREEICSPSTDEFLKRGLLEQSQVTQVKSVTVSFELDIAEQVTGIGPGAMDTLPASST